MIPDLQVEHGEPEESSELLENYDVEDAIKVVLDLADELIAATAHAKHHFRREMGRSAHNQIQGTARQARRASVRPP